MLNKKQRKYSFNCSKLKVKNVETFAFTNSKKSVRHSNYNKMSNTRSEKKKTTEKKINRSEK